MPPMVFQAPCAACGQVRKFMEFKAEPCSPGSEAQRRYGFRCLSCKALVEGGLVDKDGRRHGWVDGRHVEADA